MARPRIGDRLKRLWATFRKRQQAGFTLIELLVAMFIGSIITLSLLALVVQLVDVNQRDASRSETQRDMQSAMNYITQELREAIFVYDGDCLQGTATITTANFASDCPGLINYIPPGLSTASGGNTPTPILAFWRADPLPQGLLTACSTSSSKLNLDVTDANYPTAVKGVPCLSGRSYTLVVYTLVDDGNPNDIWQGRARIVRYQLPQFTSNATSAANITPGYVDPLSSPNSSFQQWPFQLTADASGNSVVSNAQTLPGAGGRPADGTLGSNSAVLVDYVDDGLFPITPACAANSSITPKDPVPNNIRSFYACVRGQTHSVTDAAEQGVNQEVQVFLVGNVQGRPGFPLTTALPAGAIESQAFPLQTRVLSRGIINKSPK